MMKTLRQLRRLMACIAREIWRLPQTIARSATHRRQKTELNEQEVERLDRIRNPSKYLGK